MAYTDIDKPTDYFNTKLYTGNGGTNNITGLDFQPDWVWIKSRNDSANHNLFDVVRGATKYLKSNAINVETTDSTSLTSFNSNGFTLGSNNDQDVNKNNDTYVSWSWKAGTSFSNDASSTSVGSIDSAGSVSTDAGFSIIGFTGDAQTGTTVAHGLGVKPNMIIVKNREPDVANWQVYHSSLGATKYLGLNENNASVTSNTRWNNTEPTTSVFTLGSSGDVVGDSSGETFIAYCFAEKQGYSKFGSFSGNGNADGAFIYTGFKPAWVMMKASSATGNWGMFDNKRIGYNVKNYNFRADQNNAEGTDDAIDILSSGFKIRSTSGGFGGGDGTTYIYMAFAENPFTTSTGVPATAR